jgi:hypothetical protein
MIACKGELGLAPLEQLHAAVVVVLLLCSPPSLLSNHL